MPDEQPDEPPLMQLANHASDGSDADWAAQDDPDIEVPEGKTSPEEAKEPPPQDKSVGKLSKSAPQDPPADKELNREDDEEDDGDEDKEGAEEEDEALELPGPLLPTSLCSHRLHGAAPPLMGLKGRWVGLDVAMDIGMKAHWMTAEGMIEWQQWVCREQWSLW